MSAIKTSPIKTSPYGSWRSPITSDLIVQGSIGIADVILDQGTRLLAGGPSRKRPAATCSFASNADGSTTDINPSPFNARTRVHEYGGGAVCLADGMAYCSNDKDQRLYRLAAGSRSASADAGARHKRCSTPLRRRPDRPAAKPLDRRARGSFRSQTSRRRRGQRDRRRRSGAGQDRAKSWSPATISFLRRG